MSFARPRHRCHKCRAPVELERKPGRRDECRACGAELHVCLNCALFDPSLSRGCRESQADDVREKDRANFCAWFEFRSTERDESAEGGAAEAARAFFGMSSKPEKPRFAFKQESEPVDNPLKRFFEPERKSDDEERARASDAFEALFTKKDE